jgi:hypothetical protein
MLQKQNNGNVIPLCKDHNLFNIGNFTFDQSESKMDVKQDRTRPVRTSLRKCMMVYLNSKCEKSDFYNYKRPNGRKFKNCINE